MKSLSVLVGTLCLLSGCSQERNPIVAGAAPTQQSQLAMPAVQAEQAQVVVYKSPSCGCCAIWIQHMQRHGFPVQVHDVDNVGPIKERVGVPYAMGSCHTAEVGGYFIEGHVPAAEVERLLAERPKAKGLTVPGMPIGSPGMEQGERVDPYEVHLVHEDGTTSVYAKYPK